MQYILIAVVSLFAFAGNVYGATPLSERVTTSAKMCSPGAGPVRVPMITWGGDMATILANGGASRTQSGSIFASQGQSFELYREDVFENQVESFLKGETPYLRGTLGQLAAASEVSGADLVVIYQMTWSGAQKGEQFGGDTMVVRGRVNDINDIRKIAIMTDGPHVDFANSVLASVGKTLGDVEVVWVPDLVGLEPSAPGGAFYEDDSIDAAFMILPDALALTNNGTTGDGSLDSVAGARMYMTTKSASRVIADAYATCASYLTSNRSEVQNFVHGLMKGAEALESVMKKQGSSEYNNIVRQSAGLLLDDEGAVDDTIGLYLGAEFVGYPGNVQFFGSPQQPRSFKNVTAEISSGFLKAGITKGAVSLDHAKWDYNVFKSGLVNTANVTVPKFDAEKAAAFVATVQQQGGAAGEVFSFEVYFAPKQTGFSVDAYRADFDRAINEAAKYAGALVIVEGHADPNKYLSNKSKGMHKAALQQQKQGLKNMSMQRAQELRTAVISHANNSGIAIDESQFTVDGRGIENPNTPGCTFSSGDLDMSCKAKSKAEWEQLNGNRRVRLSIVQVETESTEWE